MGRKVAYHGVRAFQFRQRRGHALYDPVVDLGHSLRHLLVQLDDIWRLSVQRLFNLRMEAS